MLGLIMVIWKINFLSFLIYPMISNDKETRLDKMRVWDEYKWIDNMQLNSAYSYSKDVKSDN
jgi:hypothetical protein